MTGRFLVEDLIDEKTGELIMSKDVMMKESDAERIVASGVTKIKKIRPYSPVSPKHGVCIKCYGMNLATSKPVGPWVRQSASSPLSPSVNPARS